MNSPQSLYQASLQKHQQALDQLQKRRSRLAWLRFIVFVATAALSVKIFISFGLWGLLPLTLGLALLLFLVSRDIDNNHDIKHQEQVIKVIQTEVDILELKLPEQESLQMPADHDYANDMDILGQYSLFSWLNRAQTGGGKSLLANNLLYPISSERIKARQEATDALQAEFEWRQNFIASGKGNVSLATRDRLLSWNAGESIPTGNTILTTTYGIAAIGLLLATVAGWINPFILSSLYPFMLIISGMAGSRAAKPYLTLTKISDETRTLARLMRALSSMNPQQNTSLQSLQSEAKQATEGINQLQKILNAFDNAFNILGFLFLNPFLLWSLRQTQALARWQARYRSQLPKWFESLEEAEVLVSLAAVETNNPGWAKPAILDGFFTLEAKDLGHPLLHPSKSVLNDVQMQGRPQLMLITGSNMAGKSTFLRSMGVNVVLAQMGSRVCATAFSFTPCQLVSSMRIADNLAENTSTFYAELRKLKQIIDYVNEARPVLVLLDEILRGTNSADRHTGTAALIEQFIRENAVVVLATHDLQLAKLEEKYPGVLKNYHFDVQVAGEELYFDYKFKPGVCQSLNASILMKKIGIRMPG